MKFGTIPRALLLLAFICVALSCSRDPQVRKRAYFDSGEKYLSKQKYAEAVIEFSNAVQIDPQYGDAYYELAKAHIKLESWPSAYSELKRTIELQPGNYAARLDLANLLISVNDLGEAKPQIDLLLKNQPANALVHSASSNLLAAQGNIPGAIEEIQKAITLAPNRWQSYISLAVLQARSNSDVAEETFKKTLQLNPNSVDGLLAYSDFWISRHRLPDAEREIRAAIAADPKSTAPYSALTRLLVLENRPAEAESLLKQVRQDFPDNSVGYRMLGDFYFATGEIDKATAEYGSLYQAHPKDARVKLNYTQLLIVRNRLDEAKNLDDEILKDYPFDYDALICRGQIENAQGYPDAAVKTLRLVIENVPDNAIAHYHLGVAYDGLGKLDLAQNEWQNAVRLNPDLIDAHLALAGVALRKNDALSLQRSAEQIIRLAPASPDGYNLRAVSYIKRERFDDAEQNINRAISLAPQSAPGYVQRGELRVAEKRYAEAEQAFHQALDFDPNSAAGLSGLMDLYVTEKQPEKAIAAARNQITKAPNNSEFEDLLGTMLFRSQHDLKGAESELAKAVQRDPRNIGARMNLARVQAAEGATDQAIATLQDAAKENPRVPDLYILAGEFCDARHDSEGAEKMYRKALEISPDNARASNDLAYLMLHNRGNVDIALSLAQTAWRGMPDSPNAADTLGWGYYQKGLYKPAIDLFKEGLRLIEQNRSSEDAAIHYHLALAYERVHQPELARRHFQRALEINPNFSEADDVKKQLAALKPTRA